MDKRIRNIRNARVQLDKAVRDAEYNTEHFGSPEGWRIVARIAENIAADARSAAGEDA